LRPKLDLCFFFWFCMLLQQKFIIKVSMNGLKSRSRAMKIVVSLSGVESATLVGEDKTQIEVVGDGVDPVEITNLLRKRMAGRTNCLVRRDGTGYAELIKVEVVKNEEDQGGKEEDQKKGSSSETMVRPLVWQHGFSSTTPQYIYVEPPYSPCSIL
ncbi:hypothetical protein Tsubulata_030355, partial [Turnera subulata]